MARKQKEKSAHIGLVFYLLLVVALGLTIYKISVFVWDACAEYQANSAKTVMAQTVEKIRGETGLDISYSPIPSVDENGDSTYILKIDKTPVGKARLGVKKKIFTLALYELKDYEGTRSFEFYAPEGVSVKLAGEDVPTEKRMYYFGATTLYNYGDDRDIPLFYRYKVEGIYDFSQIEISCEGHELTESVQPRLDPITFYEKRFSPEVEEEIKERARIIAQTYSNYISLDVKWAKLKNEIMDGSNLLALIPMLEVQWYNAHNSWDMTDVCTSRPLCLNDCYALIHITYDYNIYRGSSESNFPTELAFYLHLDDDGVWRLAELGTNLYYDFEMSPLE